MIWKPNAKLCKHLKLTPYLSPCHHIPAYKGTIIEVNVSELGLVTPGGKVIWGKYAQITNSPENDGTSSPLTPAATPTLLLN